MIRAWRLTTIGLATLAASAIAAAPAEARLVRPVSSFTPTGLVYIGGVAVDNSGDAFTGDVYVADRESGNIERFSATGVREPSFAPATLEFPRGVAVDDSGGASKGDVYVAEVGEKDRVVKLESSGKDAAGFTPITASSIPLGDPGSEGFSPYGVAIDPSNGDVVVTDGSTAHEHMVDIFSSFGVFIEQFKTPGAGEGPGVAVGSGSEIFTGSTAGAGAREWSPADKYEVPTLIEPGYRSTVAVDVATGDVFVGDGEEEGNHITEYASTLGAPLLQFGAGLVQYTAGVAVDEATNTVYATSVERDAVEIFGAPVELPEVITGTPATGVTATAADVAGTVNPGGVEVTGCRFEYGLSTAYGASVPCAPAPQLTGSTAIPVSASLEVHPDETYHYRLVAVNANGSEYGEDQTFQTEALAPSLQNESVSAVGQTAATLNATIDPNDQETTYHFEYGPTTAYGTLIPAPDASIGSGYENVVVGQQLTGLQPGTTYHYRVLSTNATSPAGGNVGPDQTFTTPPLQPPVAGTGQAQGVAQNTATLTGTIDTQGYQTEYEFDFGTDTGYGTRIFGNAGSEPGEQTFTVALQGLAPGTTYHYRIAATNTFGTTYGLDVTFTTGTYLSATLAAPSTELLIATQVVAFPTEANTTTTTKTTTKCVKPKKLSHGKCVKVKSKKKKAKAKKAAKSNRGGK